uniref:Cytochrome c oxidase subunit III n=1 Tax=uncultured Helicobacter sp. TaxID=175537 RepID=A0A650EMI3_9HELI|nr:cytochrome c oxidase subunit III [uncultured Helicobacter sp.]
MKKSILFVSIFVLYGLLNAEEVLQDSESSAPVFSQNEYGKNLYENPRGIACNKCHGQKGEGGKIADYKHKGVNKTLFAPQINNVEFSVFQRALNKQKGVMPQYYLTDEEITAIYMYLYQP